MTPKIVKEELWDVEHKNSELKLIVVTTNSFMRHDSTLVMGRGAALQATQKFPNIDKVCANRIKDAMFSQFGRLKYRSDGVLKINYGFLIIYLPQPKKIGLGIFQVKTHWRTKATLSLIKNSVKGLERYARQHPETQVRMNFPGIGYGQLNRHVVEPLLQSLPSNVTICYK